MELECILADIDPAFSIPSSAGSCSSSVPRIRSAAVPTPASRARKASRRRNRFPLSARKHKNKQFEAAKRRDAGLIPAYVSRHLRTDSERTMYRIARKAADVAAVYRLNSSQQKKDARNILKTLHAHFNVLDSQFQRGLECQRMNALEDVLWRACMHLGIRFDHGTAMQQLDMLEDEIDHCKRV